jgi:ATP-dependent Clp protease protease subunit
MADILKDGELYLYGTVGADLWGDGFTALDVVDALAEVGRGTDVSVHLNSGGGYASEGAAIYNALAAHRGHKTIYVDGIAASAASLVAMAGDQIVMRKGSVMMIHDPAGITIGSAADHEKSIESLNALANSFADIYAEKSGKTVKEARADMRSEVWLTGQQAVEQGYATHLVEAEAIEPTMFGYHLYQHPPSYVMMANSPKPPKSEGRARLPTAPAVPPSQTGDNPMAHQPADPKPALTEADVQARVNEAISAHNQRTEAILSADEAKGREDLAKFLAFSTTLSVDAAKAALAKSPKPAEPAANPFEAAMRSGGNPQIGPDAPNAPGGEPVAQAGLLTARMSKSFASRAKQ